MSQKDVVRPMIPFVADVFYQNKSTPPLTDNTTVNETNSSNSVTNKRLKTTKKSPNKSINLAQSKHKKNNSSTTMSPTTVNQILSTSSSNSNNSSRSNSIITVNSTEPSEFSPSQRNEDIRLTYARIFMEAFNNFERVSQRERLSDFCTQDCMLTVKWTGQQGTVDTTIDWCIFLFYLCVAICLSLSFLICLMLRPFVPKVKLLNTTF